MKNCSTCGKPIDPAAMSAAKCPHCGAALAPTPPGAGTEQTIQFDPRSLPISEHPTLDDPAQFSRVNPTNAPPQSTDAAVDIGRTAPDRRLMQTMEFDAPATSAPETPQSAAPPPGQPDARTVPDRRLLQTMDLGPGGVPLMDPARPPEHGDEPKKPGGTVPDRRIMQTVDLPADGAAAQSSDLIHHVSGVWGDAMGAPDAPGMTIRGIPHSGRKPENTLVVKSRLVADTRITVPEGADYELLDVLGEGGMGVVYVARQASIDRTVAIKMLKPGFADDYDQRQKFLSEAVVTGDLDHPNIVPMYDLGANEAGALFYAMKRVQGTPWSHAIDHKTQTENIEILLKVADAVAFAHSRGVVHRDLKPENVMLGDFGEVLVMDWGLAYSTRGFRKSGRITQSQSMGGTPAYMAPEMAMGPIDRIGPASDIYLLGAILYEIVTGRPPHRGETISACLLAAACNDIHPTEKSGELIEIARRALATQPEERFESVREFQEAIRRYQSHSQSIALAAQAAGDLVDARESGSYETYARAVFGCQEAIALWDGNHQAERLLKEARLAYAERAAEKGDYDLAAGLLDPEIPEHATLAKQVAEQDQERRQRQQRLKKAKRVVIGLAASMLVVVTAALVIISAQRDRAVTAEAQATVERDRAVSAESQTRVERDRALVAEKQAREDRDLAEQAKDAEEKAAYAARIGLAAARIDENAFEGALELLESCPEEYRHWEWGRLRYLCGRSQLTINVGAPTSAIAALADGQHAVTGDWQGRARIWRLSDGGLEREWSDGGRYVHAVAVSPDGKWIATGGSDAQGYVKLWDAQTGKRRAAFDGHRDSVLSVVFSPSGRWLATGSYDGTAIIWNVASGKPVATLAGHSWWVHGVAFSPDETQVVTVSQDGTAMVWLWESVGKQVAPQVASVGPLDAALSTGSKTIAGPRAFRGHRGAVFAAAFSPDGERIASAGHDARILVWNVADAEPLDLSRILADPPAPETPFRALQGHVGPVYAVRYSANGKFLVSGGQDNAVVVWNAERGTPEKVLRGHAGQVRSCEMLGDEHVLSAGHDGQAMLWNFAAYEEQRVLDQRVLRGHADAILSAEFSADGKQIVTAGRDRTAIVWRVADGSAVRKLEEGHSFLVSNAAFFSTGDKILTAAGDGTARVWDTAAGTELLRLDGTSRSAAAAISADGRLIFTSGADNAARLFDAANGQLIHALPAHRGDVTAVAISPSGKRLAVGEASGRVNAYDAATGQLIWTKHHHSRRVTGVALVDDHRLLSASIDNTVGQWNTSTGEELTDRVLKHPAGVTSLALLPDRRAATSCEDGRVRLWDIDAAQLSAELPLTGKTSQVSVSADGRILAAASIEDRTVRQWDLNAGREILGADGQGPWLDATTAGSLLWGAAVSPDGSRIVTVGGNDARLWNAATTKVEQSFAPNGAVADAAFSPDGQQVVTASWDDSAKIWDIATGHTLRKLADQHRGNVNAAAFARDGRRVLTAGDDGVARLWDATNGQVIRSWNAHDGRINAAVFSSDGRYVVTAGDDKLARVWAVDDPAAPAVDLKGHDWAVLGVDFSADGERVITASADNSARVWNARTGAALRTLTGHTARVTSAGFSPDGDRVVTGSQDTLVKIWDAGEGKELLTLKGHQQEVTAVRFSPNGRLALSGSRDGTAILWLADDWRPPEPPRPMATIGGETSRVAQAVDTAQTIE